jgi:hypothetical protein
MRARAQGLVAAYSFDEGNGTTVADLSGHGNNGTLQNAAWTTGGKFGGALVFNGQNAKVAIPAATSLDLLSGMTIEAWVDPTVVPSGWWTVVHKETDVYYLAAGSGQHAPAAGATLAAGNVNAYGSSPLTANVWTHLALTYDGTFLRVYVNGLQVAAQATSGALAASSGPLSIGGDTAYGDYFNGRIDEVRVYNRALSSAEIQTDMTQPVAGAVPDGPKLVVTSPTPGVAIQGGSVDAVYSTTGSLTEVHHAQFQIDGGSVSEDPSFDGAHQLAGVHVGSHTLNGWLVRSDHSKIAGSDATPVSFSNVADPSDPTPPTAAISFPASGATVSGVTTVAADAFDNVGVDGVQLRLDGVGLGSEGSTSPYAIDWNTAGVSNGTHALTAAVRDAAGNETISAPVDVNVSNAVAVDPSVVGQWAGPFAWPLVTIHTTLMPNGKVLLYDDHTTTAGVQVWDPVADTLTSKPYNSANLFCSAHTVLVDGRVLVVGGQVSTLVGLQAATIFNPTTQTWSAAAPMTYGRWYPTATALPNGKVLATSGAIDCPTCGSINGSHAGIALIPEIYDPNANTWSQLSSASLSLPLYPHMHVLPDGRVLAVSSQEDPIVSRVLDLTAQTWTVVDPALRDGGSSVMYRPGKILKTGSARNPDYPAANAASTAYVIDMNLPSPTWRAVANMADARTQHNLTMLPDGNVLLVGGGTTSDVYATSSAVKAAALWSPTTETWTALASMSEPRLYHSTALLLPDARVLVSGGGRFGPDFPSAEIFSPPYLFKGARPTITSAPGVVQYNSHFTVGTPNGAGIAQVTLLRLGSVTHAFNENQRYVELSFGTIGGGLDVTAPTSLNIVPPGHYMLFLVDNTGVPSVSTILRFPAPWEDNIAPTAPSGLAASASPGEVALTWSAATDNLGVALYNVHRGTSPNVTPTVGNRVGQTPLTNFDDTGFATGTYYYVVTAQDANGNVGVKSNEVSTAATADATAPTVAVVVPAPNALLSGVVTLTASASDDVGVVGVQFLLDGASFGAEDLAAPFTIDWNTVLAANGSHTISARARDARGNLTTATIVPVAVSNGAASGLVAAYSFNEGAGTLAFDASGANNRGTVTSATWTASGHTAGALSFDGTTDYVRATTSSTLNNMGSGLTIEMWANITGSSATDYVLLAKPWTNGTTGNPPYEYGVEYDANGLHTLDFYFGDTTNTRRGPYSITPVLGTWTHLAFTFEGTTVKGYLDGVLKISSPITATIQSRATDLLIGVDGALSQGFNGRLDDVRLYNRALSQVEIQTDMGRPVSPAIPPVPDGSFGTSMKATRTAVDGSTIDLTWDVSGCTAKGYHVVYGPLANLATYEIDGGVCGMGTSGSFSWTSAPACDLWFVVVGDDLNGTEGTWGNQSAGGAMDGFVPSSVCGMTNRVNLNACP